jgi:hypothetical protein
MKLCIENGLRNFVLFCELMLSWMLQGNIFFPAKWHFIGNTVEFIGSWIGEIGMQSR